MTERKTKAKITKATEKAHLMNGRVCIINKNFPSVEKQIICEVR